MVKRNVYIVEDDETVSRSLTRLLKSVGWEVQAFLNPIAFLDVAPKLPQGGCLLLDIRLPGIDGLELQSRLIEGGIGMPIIMMTGQADVPTAVRAMKTGAIDFLEKPIDDEQLLRSINSALNRPEPRDREHQVISAAKRLNALTPRERNVLDGLVAGNPNKVIAAQLGISVRTVEGYRIRMLKRLGTQRLAEAIRIAVMASLAAKGGG
jgi:two-component system response regulator FixJ